MVTKKLRLPLRPRRAVIAASLVMTAVAMLSACSGTPSTSNTSSGLLSGTLNVLTPSAGASDNAFRALNAAFEAKYPNVKVQYTTVPTNNYASVESSRLTANNVDILVASPVEVPKYVTTASESNDSRAADAGTFLDLKGQSFMKNFTPSVLDALRYKGHDYGVPTGLSYYTGVYYNKSIFAKYNLSIPTTWSEFVALCKKLQDAGIAPLGIGGKDSWPAGLTMLAAVQGSYPTLAEKQALAKSLWSQQSKLTDPKLESVLAKVKTMYDFAEPNFAGVSYSAVPAEFAKGTVAMTPDGTWNEPTISAAVGSAFKYGYFPIPTSETAANNKVLGGKVEIRIAVVKATKNKAAALAYLAFYSQPTNYAQFVKAAGFAPAQPNIPSSAFLDSIKPYTSPFSLAWDNMWTSNSKSGPAALFPFNYTGVAPLGTGSVAEAAAAAQKDWAAGF